MKLTRDPGNYGCAARNVQVRITDMAGGYVVKSKSYSFTVYDSKAKNVRDLLIEAVRKEKTIK